MAEKSVVSTKRDGVIAYQSASGAQTYTVAKEAGDFSFDVPLETVNLFLDRGEISATPDIRKGDDQPVTFSHTAYLKDIGSPTAAHATLMDIAARFASGHVAANWTSTMGTNSDVHTVSMTYVLEGSNFGGVDQTLTFSYVVVRASMSEGDPSTVSINGTAYQLRPVLS
jgi:hypothetical protein